MTEETNERPYKTVKLKTPIYDGQTLVEKIKIYKPKVRDLKHINIGNLNAMTMGDIIDVANNCLGDNHRQGLINEVYAEDTGSIVEVVTSFLSGMPDSAT